MEALKNKILAEAQVLNENVLIVDTFLNHQVDAALMSDIGREFARLAAPLSPTRVVTIESSGIAPAQMTALILGLPLVIMKKSTSSVLSDGILQTDVFSFTKNMAYKLTVKSEFITPGDRVLFIDDFLATGEAAVGAAKLVEARGGSIALMGIVIEKSFQSGRKWLDGLGYNVASLARISGMSGGQVEFAD